MKYKDNGQFKPIYVKALDSMPVGTEVDFDGQASDIPVGWEQVENEVVLYNNVNGTTGNVSLNDSIANYSRFKIYGFYNDGSHNAVDFIKEFLVTSRNAFDLSGIFYDGTSSSYMACETATISGTSITRGTQHVLRLSSTPSRDVQNIIYITKIIGFIDQGGNA